MTVSVHRGRKHWRTGDASNNGFDPANFPENSPDLDRLRFFSAFPRSSGESGFGNATGPRPPRRRRMRPGDVLYQPRPAPLSPPWLSDQLNYGRFSSRNGMEWSKGRPRPFAFVRTPLFPRLRFFPSPHVAGAGFLSIYGKQAMNQKDCLF